MLMKSLLSALASLQRSKASLTKCHLGQRIHSFSTNVRKGNAKEMEEVVIAIGTNVGDRVGNINRALTLLRQAGISVNHHACLYQSAPAYVLDQPCFLNSAVTATTTMPPLEVLHTLKDIERELGRQKGGVRFGPRPLDLDIIFYGRVTMDTQELQIPHPRYHERSFVLAPLVDLCASPTTSTTTTSTTTTTSSTHGADERSEEGHSRLGGYHRDHNSGHHDHGHYSDHHNQHHHHRPLRDPATVAKVTQLWQQMGGEALVGGSSLQRVMPVAGTLWDWSTRTHLMGVLNVTPDSFSDGGKYMRLEDAVEQAEEMARGGAAIIDVGGQSTRPGAARVSSQEEMARVVPVIKALSSNPALKGILLSIDTFHSQVASAAVAAGAHIVNDISGGSLDPGMRAVVAGLEVPYVLMHIRGDPTTMQRPEHRTYNQDTCTDVATELRASAAQAEAAGIPAWRLILDPGIGFAKGKKENLDILRDVPRLRKGVGAESAALSHCPLLLGPSRKKFLGSICGREKASDCDWATATAVAAAVHGGCEIVRVHNVPAMHDVVQVADTLWHHHLRLLP